MTAVGNWWRYFRQRGLLVTIQAIIIRYIYRRRQYLVLRCGLAGPPADDHIGDIVFRLATPSDLDRLDEFDAYGRGSTQRAHVKDHGDWLFVACHGDRIVATRRYSRVVRDGLMSRVVQLNPGQVWAADVFSLPEYRSQGIGGHLGLFADRFLASRDYTELFSSVSVTNTPSIRVHLRIGRRPAYYISDSRLLFYERLRVSKTLPRRLGRWMK